MSLIEIKEVDRRFYAERLRDWLPDVADVFCDNALRLLAGAGGPGRTS